MAGRKFKAGSNCKNKKRQISNAYAVKVNKRHNGNRGNVKACKGISRDQSAELPLVQVGKPYEIRVRSGYVDIWLLDRGVVRVNPGLKNYWIRLGRLNPDGSVDYADLHPMTWYAIASCLNPKKQYTTIGDVYALMDRVLAKRQKYSQPRVRQIIHQ